MKFEKGKQYECITDVLIHYTNGEVYTCHNEGCLTDETGYGFRYWSEEIAKYYFKPYEPQEQPKMGDEVLAWDDDEDAAEEYIFFTKVDGEFPYVVFDSEIDYVTFNDGLVFECISYKNVKPLPKVETMTMAEALKFIKEIKGVEVKIEG